MCESQPAFLSASSTLRLISRSRSSTSGPLLADLHACIWWWHVGLADYKVWATPTLSKLSYMLCMQSQQQMQLSEEQHNGDAAHNTSFFAFGGLTVGR